MMPSLAIICSLMRGLEWNQEYRHSRTQGEADPEYVEIRKNVSHHREIEAELQALGYEYVGSRSGGVSGVTADTLPTSAPTSTRRTGWLKSRAPPARARAASTLEPLTWATSWRSPEDPGQSPPLRCT